MIVWCCDLIHVPLPLLRCREKSPQALWFDVRVQWNKIHFNDRDVEIILRRRYRAYHAAGSSQLRFVRLRAWWTSVAFYAAWYVVLSAKKRFNNFRIDTACFTRERLLFAPRATAHPFVSFTVIPPISISARFARTPIGGVPDRPKLPETCLSKGDENFGAIVIVIILIALSCK